MPYRAGIDVGGTFTDLVAVDDEVGITVHIKVPSTPAAPDAGVCAALDRTLQNLDAGELDFVGHSTTVATNALLGQIGLEPARVALFVTEGFRDVIEIGRGNRSEVYNLDVERPAPLVARADRIPVRERMNAMGEAIIPLDSKELSRAVDELGRHQGVESVAIAFLHSYANGAHERALGSALASRFPSLPQSLSSEVDPQYREYERTSTTVVNAALAPLVRGYLERLAGELQRRYIAAPLYVMQSSGGMAAASAVAALPAALIESGPASGVIAAAALARELRIDRLLSFDMGGTTAKAGTVVDGVPRVAYEFEAAGRTHSGRAVSGSGYPVRFGFVDLAEVSAGGGTVAWVDDGSLHVGPLSAGADPGPALYGKGEYATVTDANVVLGRLGARTLLGGALACYPERSAAAVGALAAAFGGASVEEAALGIVTLIDSEMSKVLRIVTIERGEDPRAFTLCAFGGGGPLHACALADELGVQRIVIPQAPGMFSAYGLLAADLCVTSVRSLSTSDASAAEVEGLFACAECDGAERLRAQGSEGASIRHAREIAARYAGQSFELTVAAASPFDGTARAALIDAFEGRHKEVYGYAAHGEPVELVNVRCTSTGSLTQRVPPFCAAAAASRPGDHALLERRPVTFAGGTADAPVYAREGLVPGNTFAGPAIVEQYDACTLVAGGWNARVDARGVLELERA